jgi:hypothetical protein
MAHGIMHHVVGHLRTLCQERALAQASDAQLLDCFAQGHDEAPFVALLCRHGAMVWGVSCRVLDNVQDAEDVFQATFLILARKASAIR